MHCIQRAKERYKLDFNELDIMMIEILVSQGLARRVDKIKRHNPDRVAYRLRYGRKLLAPIIDTSNNHIVTFLPCGNGI